MKGTRSCSNVSSRRSGHRGSSRTRPPPRGRGSPISRDAGSLSTVAEQLVESAARVSEARLPEGFSSLHEAVSLLSEAREQAPLDPSWRLPLARAFAALERWPEARVILEGITDARDPRRARESAELLAKCLLSLREYAACLAQCNRSLALFPDSVALARNRALAFAEGFVLGVETDGRRVVDDAAMSFFEKVIADAAQPRARRFPDARALSRVDGTGRRRCRAARGRTKGVPGVVGDRDGAGAASRTARRLRGGSRRGAGSGAPRAVPSGGLGRPRGGPRHSRAEGGGERRAPEGGAGGEAAPVAAHEAAGDEESLTWRRRGGGAPRLQMKRRMCSFQNGQSWPKTPGQNSA